MCERKTLRSPVRRILAKVSTDLLPWTALATTLLALTGCDEQPQPKRHVPYVVEGIVAFGTAETAKASGFTECEAGYYAYTCHRAVEREIFGVVPSRSEIRLDGADNLFEGFPSAPPGDVRELPASSLSYASVTLDLPGEVNRKLCTVALDPEQMRWLDDAHRCTGARVFVERLSAAGWIKVSYRRFDNYLKADTPVEIAVDAYKGRVVIRPIPVTESRERLARHLREQQERKAADANAAKVISDIKGAK